MTDPRINPADTPGTQGGGTPPQGSGGSGQSGRHGRFHWGRHGSGDQSTAGGVGTATRSTPSTSVPQQAGQQAPAPAQPQEYGRTEYAAGESMYGETTQGQDMLAKAARTSWTVLLLGALGMIALGILLLVWPNASLTVVAILFGATLCLSGAVRLYEGFTAHGTESGGMRAAYIVIGLLAVLAGVYLLRHHALSLFVIAFVAGVYFIMYGIAEIGAGASLPGAGRGLRITLGIFSIAAGLVMVIWPQISLVLLLTVMAAWLLFYGLMLAGLAFSLRRAAKSVTKATSATMAAPAGAA